MLFFEDDKQESIEALQFFFFLEKIYFSLLEKNANANRNTFIQEFIETLGKNYYWQSYKIRNYLTTLNDYVFWQSSEIYLTSMKKFVCHELDVQEFVDTILYKILDDQQEANVLEKDFEKQATLKLNPKIFQFSKIISNLELTLLAFNEEPEVDDIYLTENQLRQIIKNVLLKLKPYFTDDS